MSYKWCLHCEKVYPSEEWLKTGEKNSRLERHPDIIEMMKKFGECPNCNAGGLADGWDWEKVAKQNNYPLTPEIGKVYELYPTKKE